MMRRGSKSLARLGSLMMRAGIRLSQWARHFGGPHEWVKDSETDRWVRSKCSCGMRQDAFKDSGPLESVEGPAA